MKNYLIVGAFIMLTSLSFAQGKFKAGINGGIPVGDVSDFYNFQFGADVAYMFGVADMISVGPMVGYSNFFPDDSDIFDNAQFLPVAASGRLSFPGPFFVGADLGYAIGIDDGNDGGFFYKPQVGYEFVIIGIILSYSGVSVDGGSFSSINLGVEFGI